MSYDDKLRQNNPYAQDEGYTVHVHSMRSDTRYVPSLHDQYRQRINDLQRQYPNYEFVRDPQAAQEYYSQVYQVQEELDYYPELDPRMQAEVQAEYADCGNAQIAAHMTGYYPYCNNPNYQAQQAEHLTSESQERLSMGQLYGDSVELSESQNWGQSEDLEQDRLSMDQLYDHSVELSESQNRGQSEDLEQDRPSMDQLYGHNVEQSKFQDRGQGEDLEQDHPCMDQLYGHNVEQIESLDQGLGEDKSQNIGCDS